LDKEAGEVVNGASWRLDWGLGRHIASKGSTEAFFALSAHRLMLLASVRGFKIIVIGDAAGKSDRDHEREFIKPRPTTVLLAVSIMPPLLGSASNWC
jgi:hypothetical protein